LLHWPADTEFAASNVNISFLRATVAIISHACIDKALKIDAEILQKHFTFFQTLNV